MSPSANAAFTPGGNVFALRAFNCRLLIWPQANTPRIKEGRLPSTVNRVRSRIFTTTPDFCSRNSSSNLKLPPLLSSLFSVVSGGGNSRVIDGVITLFPASKFGALPNFTSVALMSSSPPITAAGSPLRSDCRARPPRRALSFPSGLPARPSPREE